MTRRVCARDGSGGERARGGHEGAERGTLRAPLGMRWHALHHWRWRRSVARRRLRLDAARLGLLPPRLGLLLGLRLGLHLGVLRRRGAARLRLRLGLLLGLRLGRRGGGSGRGCGGGRHIPHILLARLGGGGVVARALLEPGRRRAGRGPRRRRGGRGGGRGSIARRRLELCELLLPLGLFPRAAVGVLLLHRVDGALQPLPELRAPRTRRALLAGAHSAHVDRVDRALQQLRRLGAHLLQLRQRVAPPARALAAALARAPRRRRLRRHRLLEPLLHRRHLRLRALELRLHRPVGGGHQLRAHVTPH